MIQNKIYTVKCVGTLEEDNPLITLNSGESYTASKIVVHNPTEGIQTFIIRVNGNDLYNQAIPAHDSFIITGPLLFSENDLLKHAGTSEDLSITVFGLLVTI